MKASSFPRYSTYLELMEGSTSEKFNMRYNGNTEFYFKTGVYTSWY